MIFQIIDNDQPSRSACAGTGGGAAEQLVIQLLPRRVCIRAAASRKGGDDRRRFMNVGRKVTAARGSSWCSRNRPDLFLKIKIGVETAQNVDRPCVPAKAVIQPFVVGIIEPLLLQFPLQIPINLAHEAEIRYPLSHPLRGR